MKVIPVMSTKGGVGKSRMCVGLARAFKSKGFRVGLLDGDWVAPNLNLELGVEQERIFMMGEVIYDKVEPIITEEGFPLVSSAFLFPADQCVSMGEESLVKDIVEITSPGVVNWGDLDYLIMDTPPTTAKFIQVALKIENLFGVVLVAQPASLALADLLRTISLLRDLQVPVVGMVGNQTFVECTCGMRLQLYDLNEYDAVEFAKSQGLKYLGSIPHASPSSAAWSYQQVAEKILGSKPKCLPKEEISALPYKLLVAIAKRGGEHAKD